MWLVRRRRREGVNSSDTLVKLQRENERLLQEVHQLQEQLAARGVERGEQLFMWRAGLPLLGPAWEAKFVVGGSGSHWQ